MAAFRSCKSRAPQRFEASSSYRPAPTQVRGLPRGTHVRDVRSVPDAGRFSQSPSTLPGWRLLSGLDQALLDFPKTLAERFHKQVVLAPEMLVKASVCQARVRHDSFNRRPV